MNSEVLQKHELLLSQKRRCPAAFIALMVTPLLATNCHMSADLSGRNRVTSVYTCVICLTPKLLLSTIFTACFYTWPASWWHTKSWMESDIPRAAVLRPRNLGWCEQCLEEVKSGTTVFELDDYLLLTFHFFFHDTMLSTQSPLQ